jgi:hypothetical protein
MYPIISIDAVPTESEQLGSKLKYWFLDGTGSKILFKEGRENTGENWAEKVACELARLLQLPHAEYNFAVWGQKKGVVTRSFVPPGGRLVFGNELLAKFVRGYAQERRYRQTYHTLSAVMAILRFGTIEVPEGHSSGIIAKAADLFTGYLMLDAWIGNTDRHDENWGLLVIPPRRVELAPTFDHASSLGRELTDERRNRLLNTRDNRGSIGAYAVRARSALFRAATDDKPLSTLDAFRTAARYQPHAAAFWIEQLSALNWERVERVFGEIPRPEMTQIAADFGLRLLFLNKERLIKLRN